MDPTILLPFPWWKPPPMTRAEAKRNTTAIGMGRAGSRGAVAQPVEATTRVGRGKAPSKADPDDATMKTGNNPSSPGPWRTCSTDLARRACG
jgi:hypothetical protein